MLENERYNRALEANARHSNLEFRDVFLEQEYLTQLALENLGMEITSSPSEATKVGSLLMAPVLIPGLRIPYAVEVLGMPEAGKSTMINRYLDELSLRGRRHNVAFVEEGAASIKTQHADLRNTDPFTYSMMAGTAVFLNYISSLRDINSGMRMVISGRGQTDRGAFRRALFSQGMVDPKIMNDEKMFMEGLENTPFQICGLILFMVRPEISMKRAEKEGPVTNMRFLPRLYEQYWRIHWQVLQGEIPYRLYTCINGEEGKNSVYERFKYAMDTALNIHTIWLNAFARAFPKEFDKLKVILDEPSKGTSAVQNILSQKLGGRVLIVGGDDMEDEEDLLTRQFLEVMHLTEKPK